MPWLRHLAALGACLIAVARTDVVAQSPTYHAQLPSQDTTLNLDTANYSSGDQLTTYTWPDNRIANAIVMKFDLSGIPAGATIQRATLRLSLIASDATADSIYTITAHKIVGKNPAIAAATGYTIDGATAWTANGCCYNGVPLAQADISAPYDTQPIDKTAGDKLWTLSAMVQQWLVSPATNFGVLLNSDSSRLRDRYRYFASTENANSTLRPYLSVDYTLPTIDTTPPVLSNVAALSITSSGATITWTSDEPADSQLDEGLTSTYGTSSPLNAAMTAAHTVSLGGLKDGTLYHYRARSRDAAGNLAVSPDLTFTTKDATVPTVSISAPAPNTTVKGTIQVTATASDNVGVASVQFKVDGVNLGGKDTTTPYVISWNTTTVADGNHTLSAVARDSAGNSTTAKSITVTVANNSVRLTPQDTTLSLDATNYSTNPQVMVYTWPDNQVANDILMKFDTSSIPAGATVQQATLGLALVASDATADATYTITAHKMLGKNAVIAAATGYTFDGVSGWTANGCCWNGVAMAEGDISAAYDTQAIDKANGYKTWSITSMVQEWVSSPATNMGVLLNADASKLRDRYRYFASMEYSDPTLRPYLVVKYGPAAPDTKVPTVSITSPATNASVSGTISVTANASDNVAVAGVQFRLDGANLGAEDVAAPYSVSWDTTTAAAGTHTLSAVARDGAGNTTTASSVVVNVAAVDTTPPLLSAIIASSITASGATVTWTTDEASDSQVDYGQTTAYSSTSALNATRLTAHAVAVSGLGGSTVYHYRVRSRDAAGNLAMSGDATFTTPAVTTSTWPHQPSGFGSFMDWSMDALTGSGWIVNNSNAYASIVADATAPVTASNVGQWKYPVGFAGGVEPAIMSHPLPSTLNEGFVGVAWKPSNPWQGHSTYVNKIFFLFGGACGNLIPIMYGPPGGPYQLRVAPEWGNWSWLTPNVNDVPVALGAWHKIELYFKFNTAGSGIVRWWMDGTLIGDYTNISFPSTGCFQEFQFAPTWGGVGDVKNETDYFWFDHAYMSRPSGATPSADTTPPAVSLNSPATAATISGPIIVSASASDNVGVAGVQFQLDGANLSAEQTAAPYSLSWDTTTTSNGTHTLTAVARDAAGNHTTSNSVAVTVSNIVPTVPHGTILFQEGFEDANLAGRGWYDNTTPLLSTTEHASNSVSSIQYTFNTGATSPTAGSALRRKFAPTDSVYLGYWVKYSTNWVGSQKPYHPHEFHFLTTFDGDWAGLSFDYLTTYIEQNGGTPLIGIQDGSNVDQSKIGVNLVTVTEKRGVAGCNGSSDGYPDNCYSNGTQYVNEKKWYAGQQYFTDSPGAYYKSDWHFVEAFVRMNSISAGKGVNDGVVQYWFDGRLIIDHHDVLLRTGTNGSMQFDQFVIAPWIGDGSPVTQSMWIDNLTVATGKP